MPPVDQLSVSSLFQSIKIMNSRENNFPGSVTSASTAKHQIRSGPLGQNHESRLKVPTIVPACPKKCTGHRTVTLICTVSVIYLHFEGMPQLSESVRDGLGSAARPVGASGPASPCGPQARCNPRALL